MVAAVSVGIYQGTAVADLDYAEDSAAETDMNLVMTEQGEVIEIQGTAEEAPFSFAQMQQMLELGAAAITEIVVEQKRVLAKE